MHILDGIMKLTNAVFKIHDAGQKIYATCQKSNVTTTDVVNVVAQGTFGVMQAIQVGTTVNNLCGGSSLSPSLQLTVDGVCASTDVARTVTHVAAYPSPQNPLQDTLDVAGVVLSQAGNTLASVVAHAPSQNANLNASLETTATVLSTAGTGIIHREAVTRVAHRTNNCLQGVCERLSSTPEEAHTVYCCSQCGYSTDYWWSSSLGFPEVWPLLPWESNCSGCNERADYVRSDKR